MELWLLVVLLIASVVMCLMTGIIFIIVGKQLNRKIGDSIIRVPATIVKISNRLRKGRRMFTPYIQYTFDGIEYNAKLHYYSSSMKVGDTIDILVDKEFPEVPKGNPRIFSITGISLIVAWVFITTLLIMVYIVV